MGGCRCVYRSCQSSTSVTPGLHYFHFPVKDKVRCDQWVGNTQKPELNELSREKLRNKVVCSLHFETRYFTNEKQDRLVHNAVPTLGHEDDPLFVPFSNDNQHVQLIAMDEENTQFTLPDVEFAGKSYMIFNDNIVPTVKDPPTVKQPKKHFQVVIKKKIASPVTRQYSPQPINSDVSDDIVFKKTDSGQMHAELKLEFQGDDSIPSYSMSELNGDLSLKLTDPVDQPMIIDEEPHVEHTFTLALPEPAPPQKQPERPQKRSQRESPTTPQLLTKKEIYDIVKPRKEDSIAKPPHEKQSKQPKQKIYEPRNNAKPHNEEQYIQMIETNTKQINTLKRLVQKQNKMNRFILQRKQMPHFRPRKVRKAMLLESLKDQLKPSLLAILKLELLPVEDVILTDNEEKFIMDLYMEHPECYDLLRNKFNWNLPSNEVIAEANEVDQ